MLKQISLVAIIFACVFMLFATSVPAAESPAVRQDHDLKLNTKTQANQEAGTQPLPRPVFSLRPREIDFGVIRLGEGGRGRFELNNVGTGVVRWSTTGPSNWTNVENQKLSGGITSRSNELSLHLSLLDSKTQGFAKTPLNIQLVMETQTHRVVYAKEVYAGSYRESIPFVSNGGTRTIFFRFTIVNGRSEPLLQVDPPKLDLGVLEFGERVIKRIQISNKGSESLKWHADVLKKKLFVPEDAKRGRYISFINEEIKGRGGDYKPGGRLAESMELTGSWTENMGYPQAEGNMSLRYRFTGKSIAIAVLKSPNGGKFDIYVDNALVDEADCFSEQRQRHELLLGGDLSDGAHNLTMIHTGGRTTVEGVYLWGKETKAVIPGAITIYPNSGITMKEIDFINISANAEHLAPGWYSDDILLRSSGGDVVVEVSFEVAADETPKIIDIYRYVKDNVYLYTPNIQIESSKPEVSGFQKEGIAFRLFKPGTPGTAPFHRWHNPQSKDYFYSYDINAGGKSLKGYIYEGPIGNIATSKLSQTKILYRWYNPSKGTNFYTTDQNGEGRGKRGYRFGAIAGYVR